MSEASRLPTVERVKVRWSGQVPRNRMCHTLVSYGDSLWLYGGEDDPDGVVLGDLHRGVVSEEEDGGLAVKWERIESRERGCTKPWDVPRSRHSAVVVGDEMVVFGGVSALPYDEEDGVERPVLACRKVWAYSFAGNTWREVRYECASLTSRFNHSCVAHAGSFVCLGGILASGRFSKGVGTLLLEENRNVWFTADDPDSGEEGGEQRSQNRRRSRRSFRNAPLPTPAPNPIAGHSAAVCRRGGNPCMVVFSGSGAVTLLDLETNLWQKLATGGAGPAPRLFHVAVSVQSGHCMLLFGGRDREKKILNDLHALDVESGEWSAVDVQPPLPARRSLASSLLDLSVSKNSFLVFHGGQSSAGIHGDLFALRFRNDTRKRTHAADISGTGVGVSDPPEHVSHLREAPPVKMARTSPERRGCTCAPDSLLSCDDVYGTELLQPITNDVTAVPCTPEIGSRQPETQGSFATFPDAFDSEEVAETNSNIAKPEHVGTFGEFSGATDTVSACSETQDADSSATAPDSSSLAADDGAEKPEFAFELEISPRRRKSLESREFTVGNLVALLTGSTRSNCRCRLRDRAYCVLAVFTGALPRQLVAVRPSDLLQRTKPPPDSLQGCLAVRVRDLCRRDSISASLSYVYSWYVVPPLIRDPISGVSASPSGAVMEYLKALHASGFNLEACEKLWYPPLHSHTTERTGEETYGTTGSPIDVSKLHGVIRGLAKAGHSSPSPTRAGDTSAWTASSLQRLSNTVALASSCNGSPSGPHAMPPGDEEASFWKPVHVTLSSRSGAPPAK